MLTETILKDEIIPIESTPTERRTIQIINENKFIRFSKYQEKIHTQNEKIRNAITNIDNKYTLKGRVLYWSFYRDFEDILFNKKTKQYESVPINKIQPIDTNIYETTGFKQSIYCPYKDIPITTEELKKRYNSRSGILNKVYVIPPKKISELKNSILEINVIIDSLLSTENNSEGEIKMIVNALKIVNVLPTNLFGIQDNQVLDNFNFINTIFSNLKDVLEALTGFDDLIKNVKQKT